MARTQSAPTPAFDPEGFYQVQLSRPVPIPGGQLLPIHRHRVKGKLLATFEPDAVVEAVPVTASAAP